MANFLLPLVASLAYQSSSKGGGPLGRVFRTQLWLPPLVASKPQSRYDGPIEVLYTNDPSAAQKWAESHFLNDRPVVVGWDMESSPVVPWREVSYHGPATVQISMVDAALVLQIAQEDDGPNLATLPFLRDILMDPSIIKAGVGIDQDMIELIRWPQEDLEAGKFVWKEAVGRLDLGGIGGKHGSTQSLKTLVDCICGVTLIKNKRLARSNWVQIPRISKQQIEYAARDAWAAAAVVDELSRRDPNQFSTEALLQHIIKDELSIFELEEKAASRKLARQKLNSILVVDDVKVNRDSLSHDELKTVKALEEEIRNLAPPRPASFNLGPLGL